MNVVELIRDLEVARAARVNYRAQAKRLVLLADDLAAADCATWAGEVRWMAAIAAHAIRHERVETGTAL